MAIISKSYSPLNPQPKFKLIDGIPHTRHIVFVFTTDSNDPMQSLAFQDWKNTEAGTWVIDHIKEVDFYLDSDYSTMLNKCAIVGYFEDKRWTEYCLKFIDTVGK